MLLHEPSLFWAELSRTTSGFWVFFTAVCSTISASFCDCGLKTCGVDTEKDQTFGFWISSGMFDLSRRNAFTSCYIKSEKVDGGGELKDLWEDKNTPHPLFNPGAIVWLPETFPHRKTTWLYPQFAKEVRQCLLSGWAHEREQFFQRCEGGFWLDDDKHLRDSLTVTHSHSCSYGSSTLGDFRWWTRSKNLHSLVALCWFWLRQGLFSHLYSPSSVSEKFNPGSPSFILNRPTSALLFTVFV